MIIQILAGSLYFNKIIYQIQLTHQTARYLLKTICEVMSSKSLKFMPLNQPIESILRLITVTDHFDGKVYETMIDWASKEPLNGITLDVNPNRFRNENKVKL
ncbi:unnamed protein product [Rhizophagus irregularis]|nr:unnamed protein product [Rhizophagus irregularis]